MKFLLADDHTIMRDAYRLLLREKYKRAKFGEVPDTERMMMAARTQHWDMIILDLFLPGGGGLAALKAINEQHPGMPVLMVSPHDRRQYVMMSFRAGAAGYLIKTSAGSELVNASERILAGGLYIDAKATDYLADAAQLRLGLSLEAVLSRREVEVMRMIVSGKSISEITGDLKLSVNTYRTYRKRILKKLQVPNDAELMYGSIRNVLQN